MALQITSADALAEIKNTFPPGAALTVELRSRPAPDNTKIDHLYLLVHGVGNRYEEYVGDSWFTAMADGDDLQPARQLLAEVKGLVVANGYSLA